MKVSLLTPTYNRPRHLEYLYRLFKAQTYPDKEWVIADDSYEPNEFLLRLSDPEVRYLHFDMRASIGAKRDRLMLESHGEYVANFDDDDYYGPRYVEVVARHLAEADFFKLTSWFGYDARSRLFHYWDTAHLLPFHYFLSPPDVLGIFDTKNIENKPEWIENNTWGYGFSHAFRRSLYQKVQFDRRLNWGEDLDFVNRVKKAGVKMRGIPDTEGLAIHMIHRTNTSSMHPNFLLPEFMVEKFFGKDGLEFVRHFSG